MTAPAHPVGRTLLRLAAASVALWLATLAVATWYLRRQLPPEARALPLTHADSVGLPLVALAVWLAGALAVANAAAAAVLVARRRRRNVEEDGTRDEEESASGEIVVLRTYDNELAARLDATILDANGVRARVLADTAGGAYPSMALVFPVRLLVREEDAALARELLDTPAGDAPAADDDAS